MYLYSVEFLGYLPAGKTLHSIGSFKSAEHTEDPQEEFGLCVETTPVHTSYYTVLFNKRCWVCPNSWWDLLTVGAPADLALALSPTLEALP